jgi:hypothetical protein
LDVLGQVSAPSTQSVSYHPPVIRNLTIVSTRPLAAIPTSGGEVVLSGQDFGLDTATSLLFVNGVQKSLTFMVRCPCVTLLTSSVGSTRFINHCCSLLVLYRRRIECSASSRVTHLASLHTTSGWLLAVNRPTPLSCPWAHPSSTP